jgi:RNA polymerase sigma factor (sigma-70 family)
VKAVRTESPREDRELEDIADVAGAEREELSEERARLIAKLGELDEEDRDLLIMRYFEDLSWDAIGEVLECSRDKARALYDQALDRLALRLGE